MMQLNSRISPWCFLVVCIFVAVCSCYVDGQQFIHHCPPSWTKMMFSGDSHTYGVGATTSQNRFSSLVAAQCHITEMNDAVPGEKIVTLIDKWYATLPVSDGPRFLYIGGNDFNDGLDPASRWEDRLRTWGVLVALASAHTKYTAVSGLEPVGGATLATAPYTPGFKAMSVGSGARASVVGDLICVAYSVLSMSAHATFTISIDGAVVTVAPVLASQPVGYKDIACRRVSAGVHAVVVLSQSTAIALNVDLILAYTGYSEQHRVIAGNRYVTIPDIINGFPNDYQRDMMRTRANALRQMGLPLVLFDIGRTPPLDQETMYADSTHMNDAGHHVYAAELLRSISSMYGCADVQIPPNYASICSPTMENESSCSTHCTDSATVATYECDFGVITVNTVCPPPVVTPEPTSSYPVFELCL